MTTMWAAQKPERDIAHGQKPAGFRGDVVIASGGAFGA
jgi:hypothetical protein